MLINKAVVYVVDEAADEHGGLRELLALSKWQAKFFSSGQEFLGEIEASRCACLLTELHTRDISASEILDELGTRGIAIPAMIVTGHADIRIVVEVMLRGALDVLQKPLQRDHLYERIQEAIEIDSRRQQRYSFQADVEARWATLTECERSVVRLILEGKSNREIAIELGCARRTIESRRANVMVKMRAASLAHLIQMMCISGKHVL